MEQSVEILLVNWGQDLIGIAAEGTKALERVSEDEELPALLECAGLEPKEKTSHPVVLTVQLENHRHRYEIPRPTALLELPINQMRPFPKLLRPLIKMKGLAALIPYHGTVVPVFDPTVITKELSS